MKISNFTITPSHVHNIFTVTHKRHFTLSLCYPSRFSASLKNISTVGPVVASNVSMVGLLIGMCGMGEGDM